MQTSHFVKATVAVVAACVGALFLAQFGAPLGQSEASVSVVAPQEQGSVLRASPPIGGVSAPRAAGSALPNRWRVRTASLYDTASGSDCTTIIMVQNFGPTSTAVDVVWMDHLSTIVASDSSTVAPGSAWPFAVYVVGELTHSAPFLAQWTTAPASFQGYAQVHADDPRVAVAAYVRCDTADADDIPNSINSIPCDPIGSTMEYFQAGMPANWMPPMAVPEIPE